jgi:hydrogenase nickel incorporation protein HypB
MCDTCGCADTQHHDHTTVTVLKNLLDSNDRLAAHNREHFDGYGVLVINLMSSPGSGKTSLLEATIEAMAGRRRIGVIEGDLETENDADRIRKHGVPAVQITTGMACHLDARMVHDALHDMDLSGLDLLFIENVGNLVCPASFDLGQHANVVLLSVTEGDDKPAKYPVIFRGADQVLITKADLLPYLDDFDPNRAKGMIAELSPETPVTVVSAKSGDGLAAWLDWLEQALAARPAAGAPQPHHHHHDHDDHGHHHDHPHDHHHHSHAG